jgi:hypothetical protein
MSFRGGAPPKKSYREPNVHLYTAQSCMQAELCKS